MGASIHAYLAVFNYIGFGLTGTNMSIGPDIAKGPDNKTDIVELICPFIYGYIGTNIVEPICPFINGHISFNYIGFIAIVINQVAQLLNQVAQPLN